MRHIRIPLLTVILAACASASAPKAAPRPSVADTAAPQPVQKPKPRPRVVLISVDGWRTDLVKDMPTVQTLMKVGAWTLKAETPQPAITVVSHAAMLTGDTPADDGVKTFEPAESKLEAWRPLKVPTVFQTLEANGVKTAALVQKKKLFGIVPRGATTAFGVFYTAEDGLVDWSCATIQDMPDIGFVFIHLADIDAAGHAHGWMSKQQVKAAKKIDGEIAALATCMHDSEAASGVPIILILTADHGGHGHTHGTTADTDRFVPWIAVGTGIKSDHELTTHVRLMDTTPTILSALGKLDAFKSDGTAVTEIFEKE